MNIIRSDGSKTVYKIQTCHGDNEYHTVDASRDYDRALVMYNEYINNAKLLSFRLISEAVHVDVLEERE
jgi:hypothetical protein